ncbi:uncharacterized protein E0L32_003422 [Thyridium curvatum]|uniref:BZIP transcription factor n=1 Tax=Thyridium curvatum TaxID=1093900 RepID=A0A507BJQ2_9PEZI|nr:uncharacterized protein E0L32_003422 [Thyridium curvatum]TPX16860.1 hypothetical protein E0L32_003422 [Thyridium curvatum]
MPPPPGPHTAPSPISGGGAVPVLANSTTSGTSPASVAESSEGSYSASAGGMSSKALELQRKRARDRKSQQAMRDRTKWTIANLSEQVAFLSQVLDERTRDLGLLDTRVRMLETENAHLRAQNAALQLSLMGNDGQGAQAVSPGAAPGPSAAVAPGGAMLAAGQSPPARPKLPWELPPLNSPPSCLADQILQGFIRAKLERRSFILPGQAANEALSYSPKINLGSLLEKDKTGGDDISNLVGDIIRSYLEIDTLPKQVAVYYVMQALLKWMVLLDKKSWELLPPWLRPIPAQLSNHHAAWIDRLPWPEVRKYLILEHPEITLDDFAATYSSSFTISWPYEHSHVLLVTKSSPLGEEETTINPVYEEHIRQLKNWNVGKAFREQWPEIAKLIDESHL